jgi:hypothetical protein
MSERQITVNERESVPLSSVMLAYGPIGLMAAGAIGALWYTGELRVEIIRLTILWSATILAFLAGVRRGLSFRTEGGPAPVQMATMLCFFVLALGALVSVSFGHAIVASSALLFGFLIATIVDPIAAKAGQAPLFFLKLRPGQMVLGTAAMALLLALTVWA